MFVDKYNKKHRAVYDRNTLAWDDAPEENYFQKHFSQNISISFYKYTFGCHRYVNRRNRASAFKARLGSWISLATEEMVVSNRWEATPYPLDYRSPLEDYEKLIFQISGFSEEIQVLGLEWKGKHGVDLSNPKKYEIAYSCCFEYPGDGALGKDASKRKMCGNTIEWSAAENRSSSKPLAIPIPKDLHGKDIEEDSFWYQIDGIEEIENRNSRDEGNEPDATGDDVSASSGLDTGTDFEDEIPF